MNIFTNDDYRRIQAWLKANAIKDSDLVQSETTIPDEDILTIVQKVNGIPTNFKINIKDFLNSSLNKTIIELFAVNTIKVNNSLVVDIDKIIINEEENLTLQAVFDSFNNQLNDVSSASKGWNIEYQAPSIDEPTVRAKYVLKDYKGVPKGDTIKVYKDSAITNVYLGTTEDTCNENTGEVTKKPIQNNNEALSIVYRLDTGKYSLVNIPIGIFIKEAEFDKYRGLGITENGQVFIKLANDVESSNYLHFNASGEISADGIENRILQDLGTIINSVVGDGTMWGQYKKEEGTKDSPTNEASRWGQYKQAEADRNERLNNLENKIEEVKQEIIYDVSAHNNSAVFESLSALLSSSDLNTLIPTSIRHGGMSIRFIQGSVQSSDNKYVQYRLMSTLFSTNEADWQGVDDEPTAGSDNLVKSGSVAYKFSELETKTEDILGRTIELGKSSQIDINIFIPYDGKNGDILIVKVSNVVNSPQIWVSSTHEKTVPSEYYIDGKYLTKDGAFNVTLNGDCKYIYLYIGKGQTQGACTVAIEKEDKYSGNATIRSLDETSAQHTNELKTLHENVNGLNKTVNGIDKELTIEVARRNSYIDPNTNTIESYANYVICQPIKLDKGDKIVLPLEYSAGCGAIVLTDENLSFFDTKQIGVAASRVFEYIAEKDCYITSSFLAAVLPTARIIREGITQNIEILNQRVDVLSKQSVASLNYFKNSAIYGIGAKTGQQIPKIENNYLTLCHVSDIHGDSERYKRAIMFADSVPNIDAMISTGDFSESTWTNQGFENTYVAHYQKTNKPVMPCIGNHDMGFETIKYDNSLANVANRFITPYIGRFGGIGQNGYYYKDFTDKKIRVIVLNEYEMPRVLTQDSSAYKYNLWYRYLSQTQVNWLIDTLGSVSNGWSVIIALHQLIEDDAIVLDNEFRSNGTARSCCYDGQEGYPLQSIIDAYIGKTTFNKICANNVGADESEVPSVALNVDFTNAKGEFICYISGHSHWDITAKSNHSTHKQINIGITTASADTHGQSIYDDIYRKIGTISEDCFNLVAFDTYKHEIRLLRIGANVTCNLKRRDYATIQYR